MTESDDRNIKMEGAGREGGLPWGGRFLSLSAFIVMMVVILSVFFFLLEPESAKVKRELEKHSEGLDEARFSKDEAYREKFESEAALLQLTLARVYNGERQPDLALAILEELVQRNERPAGDAEKSAKPDPAALRMKALYWEEMANSFRLKNEPEKMETALKNRDRFRRQSRDAAREAAERNAGPETASE